MKKLIIIALGVLAIGVTSCQKDTEIATPQENKIKTNGDTDLKEKDVLGTWD